MDKIVFADIDKLLKKSGITTDSFNADARYERHWWNSGYKYACRFTNESERNDYYEKNSERIEEIYEEHMKYWWDGGYESGHGYNGVREEFYHDQQIMLEFLFDFFKKSNIQKVIVSPLHKVNYFENYIDIVHNDIFKECMRILKTMKIRKEARSGIIVDVNKEFVILKRFIEGNFRFISRVCIFCPENGIIIEPHHHMNYMFYYNNDEKIDSDIKKTAEKYSDIDIVF